MMSDGHTYINIDAAHIRSSCPRLLAATLESPEDMVLLWDMGVNKLAAEQTDLLEEMGLAAPADQIQVGALALYSTAHKLHHACLPACHSCSCFYMPACPPGAFVWCVCSTLAPWHCAVMDLAICCLPPCRVLCPPCPSPPPCLWCCFTDSCVQPGHCAAHP